MAVKHKRVSIILRLLVIGLSVYIVITVIGLWKDLGEKQAEKLELSNRKSQIEAEIEEYKALLSDESQKKIIEKAARERFGYGYPGEEIYREKKGYGG